ncbi:hypothetical protein [Lentilactobacillus kisonensis]|nr:hypothetical protein [Lentilactobacillus kisonensis]
MRVRAAAQPTIAAKAAVAVDANTGQILYQKMPIKHYQLHQFQN